MRPLRIALVTESFYPAVDETTTTAKAVLDRLVDLGHRPLVIAPTPGLGTYRGAAVRRVSPLDAPGGQVRDALAAFAPDLLLALSPGRVGRKALKHARRQGVPSLVVEGSALLDVSADYWRRKVARRADAVVVTSTWMAGRLHEIDLDVPVWHPGVDTAAFTPDLRDEWLHSRWARPRAGERVQTDLVVVGYVGALHQRHGVRRLADLAALPGIRLVVVGDGPERERLASRLPQATLLGTLSTSDLGVALPSLDVLVHPGEHETSCHVLREAAASGVPVVAPRSGGAAGVVDHLGTGVLYDPRSSQGLARAVAAVAGDSRRALLGRHGREQALERTWVQAVDELLVEHLTPLAALGGGVRRPGGPRPRSVASLTPPDTDRVASRE